VLPYDNKTVRTGINGDPLIDYGDVQVYPSNFEMETRFRRAAEAEQWRGIVQFGLFLSGGARIHCAKFRHELTLGCGSGKGGQVIGGDMEAVGFLSTSDKENPCWIVVKAISDFADHERDTIIKTSRPVACWRAANFVLSALKNG
jgi:adenosylhomocysteine nucleosidase